MFGIGCNPLDPAALERLIQLKGRDVGKGMIVVTGTLQHTEQYIDSLPEHRREQILGSWPGPVTWILPAKKGLPASLTGGRDTIAFRVSKHPVIVELSRLCDHALVSTSANLSGHPPCKTAAQVQDLFGDKLDYVIDAPLGDNNQPTSIFDGKSGLQLR